MNINNKDNWENWSGQINVTKASAALLAASPADEQLLRGKKSTKPQKAFHSTRRRGWLPGPGLMV